MKDVDDYLDSYLDGQSDPGTAVLLVGHWGAGKTHYIKSYFERRATRQSDVVPHSRADSIRNGLRKLIPGKGKRRRCADQEANYSGYLYASFFTADGSAGISDQFLSQLYPGVNSVLGKVLGTAAMRLTGAATHHLSAGALSDLARDEDVRALKGWLANPKGRTLVFDDLERAAISVSERLSIINSYVERDGLKVIVLANEGELHRDDSYSRWKEKVIGKTIKVCSDPNLVLDALGAELSVGPVRAALKDGRGEILQVLSSIEFVNYRSIRTLIFDAQRIISILDERVAGASSAVLQLLKFSIAVGSEIRSGRIKVDDVRALQQSLIIRVKDKEKRTAHERFLLDIEERFSLVGALESVVPGSELAKYWRDGSLDVQVANRAALAHPLVAGDEHRPVWQRLWDVRRMKQEELRRALVELDASLKSFDIVNQGELLHLAGIGLTFEKLGGKLFSEFADTETWLRTYINHPNVIDRLDSSDVDGDASEFSSGFGYHNRNDAKFRAMFDELQLAVAMAEDKRLLARVPKLVQSVRELDYSNVYSFEGGGDAVRIPWLRLVDVCEMASILLEDGALRPKLSSSLIKRYDGDSGVYRPEWAWLKELRQELLSRAATLPAPFRSIVIENIMDARRRILSSVRQTLRWVSRD